MATGFYKVFSGKLPCQDIKSFNIFTLLSALENFIEHIFRLNVLSNGKYRAYKNAFNIPGVLPVFRHYEKTFLLPNPLATE
jgi:hypothetical protein